ncbi:Nse4 C-terminal-domain-containing protein [Alternaria rosae]|uniref:Nse4 C-terminal-domain-containing protein n=1 Tax=Alternaria rosae TaxID=1187941 RepID=UPI001E8E54B2|nr:Nse4 C-terminal-domain-containing protein [Alternaria rosae]KAH6878067.1 Nse4 C-terminal-domain-containing protein [Alternaria rosae]
MARLNTRLSATPQTRASTVDSLYRDPSVAPRNESNARTTSYSVLSPTRSISSDKENEQPETRANTPRRGKAGGMRSASVRMPTPDSGSTTGNGGKRRRTDNYAMAQSQIYEDGNDEHEEGEEEDMHQVETPSQPPPESDEEGDQKYYNPNQNPEQRRRLRANMRDNHRMLEDNRDDYVKSRDSGLLDAIKTQNSLFGKVRQTADATVDSRFLVSASDLAGKKLNNSLGNSGVGIDLDQFVSKCIYFMKSGGHVAGEEDAPAIPVGDDDEEDPDGLDWALLGRRACFPSNRRPPTSSFLLGPLSVQRRVRVTQKKARSQRQPLGPATRPQEIQTGDIQQNESNNLTTLVRGIRSRLAQHITVSQTLVEEELEAISDDDYTDDAQTAALIRHRIAMTNENEAAVSLLDFAINPHDFGQTVENLFYISFLVKEGNAKIVKDADGLPLLLPAEPSGVSEHRDKDVQKHQAVFSLDFPSWRMFIDAYDITTPLIPQRQVEEAAVGANGWYNG